MSAKIELQTQRQKLIEQLRGEADPRRVSAIQADLTIVNAEIKKLNITEAAENGRNAAVRKALGNAQHEADIARANERITAGSAPGGEFGFRPKPQKQLPAPKQPPFLTRGEFLLKNAKQMLKTIEALKQENKLPHTIAFEEPLREFVEAQRAHVEQRKAERKEREEQEPHDWEQTWAD